LTKKFAAVLAGLMMLPLVVSAQGEKGIPATLERLFTELANINAKLNVLLDSRAPDLVPNPYFHHFGPEGPADFCRILESGQLWVSLHNQGEGRAEPSVTEVYFRVPPDVPVQKSCGGGCAQVDLVTPAIDALRSVQFAVAIPEGCFGSVFGPDDINNCLFKINVDARNSVNESIEANNRALGSCQGLL
jgi:hypothetical protein